MSLLLLLLLLLVVVVVVVVLVAAVSILQVVPVDWGNQRPTRNPRMANFCPIPHKPGQPPPRRSPTWPLCRRMANFGDTVWRRQGAAWRQRPPPHLAASSEPAASPPLLPTEPAASLKSSAPKAATSPGSVRRAGEFHCRLAGQTFQAAWHGRRCRV